MESVPFSALLAYGVYRIRALRLAVVLKINILVYFLPRASCRNSEAPFYRTRGSLALGSDSTRRIIRMIGVSAPYPILVKSERYNNFAMDLRLFLFRCGNRAINILLANRSARGERTTPDIPARPDWAEFHRMDLFDTPCAREADPRSPLSPVPATRG